MTEHMSEPPVMACTLASADYKARLAEIAALNTAALLAHRRDDLRLELTYAAAARERVVSMVRAERACCGFLTFDIREETGGIRLVIEVPDAARAAAENAFDAFLSRTVRETGCGCCEVAS